MDMTSLQFALQEAGPAALGIGFVTGFVFSFNPLAFAAIPVTLAYVTKARAPWRAVQLGGALISGMIVTHIVLGVAAALGGEWAGRVLGRQWGLVLGPLLIVLGLLWPGWIRLPLPWFSARAARVTGAWGAFLLGIPFTVAVCPVCTPALLVALTAAAGVGSATFGFALLLAFALGRAVPIIVGAASLGWLESLKVFTHWQKAFEVVGGLTLIASGAYLIYEHFFIM